MASTRKPRPADPAARDLLPRLRAQLADTVPPGSRILVALSGGVDSVVLLDLMRRVAARRRWRLSALHVDHQLQPQSAEWAKFCRRMCRDAGVPLRVVKVEIPAGNSLERAARLARYDALLARRADFIALAHNQDDQAETVLLHLFRGAGISGLAGMQLVSDPPVPITSVSGAMPRMLRPLLDLSRADIARYATHRKLEWIEDPSNQSSEFTRNFLRGEILPRVAERFPACREALARASRHAAEAVQLLDELARTDRARASAGNEGALSVAGLRALTGARAKNALRHFLRERRIEVPSASWLEETLRQVLVARADRGVCIAVGDVELRVHRGAVILGAARDAARPLHRVWTGQSRIQLPELGGTLRMGRARGEGISAARLRDGPVTIRARRGGERLRPHGTGSTRTVKNLMQEARMPPWQRDRVPFIYCGEQLVCVPGIAIHSAFQAGPLEPCIVPSWSAD